MSTTMGEQVAAGLKVEPVKLNLRALVLHKQKRVDPKIRWWHRSQTRYLLALAFPGKTMFIPFLVSVSESVYNQVEEKQVVSLDVEIKPVKFYTAISNAPAHQTEALATAQSLQEKSTMKVTAGEGPGIPVSADKTKVVKTKPCLYCAEGRRDLGGRICPRCKGAGRVPVTEPDKLKEEPGTGKGYSVVRPGEES